MIRELGPLATSETTNPFRYFDKTPWTGDRPIARSLTYTEEHHTKKCGHRALSQAGFELTTPFFERSKLYAP